MDVRSSIAFLLLALYLFLSFLSVSSTRFFPRCFHLWSSCSCLQGVKKEKLIESIETKRKLTTTGWLVLLFCLETNVAISLLEEGESAFPVLALNCFVFFFFFFMYIFPPVQLGFLSLIADVAFSTHQTSEPPPPSELKKVQFWNLCDHTHNLDVIEMLYGLRWRRKITLKPS